MCRLFLWALFCWDLMKAPPPPPPSPPHLTHPWNDRRHLALWTWRDPVQDEMEAYFGKPTKALKCKPPAACLAADVFVLMEGAAVAFHRGTRQERRAMCGLLIFKPSGCQASAVGMRPRTHKPLFPQSPSSSASTHMDPCQPRGSFRLRSGDFFVYDLFGNEARNRVRLVEVKEPTESWMTSLIFVEEWIINGVVG